MPKTQTAPPADPMDTVVDEVLADKQDDAPADKPNDRYKDAINLIQVTGLPIPHNHSHVEILDKNPFLAGWYPIDDKAAQALGHGIESLAAFQELNKDRAAHFIVEQLARESPDGFDRKTLDHAFGQFAKVAIATMTKDGESPDTDGKRVRNSAVVDAKTGLVKLATNYDEEFLRLAKIAKRSILRRAALACAGGSSIGLGPDDPNRFTGPQIAAGSMGLGDSFAQNAKLMAKACQNPYVS